MSERTTTVAEDHAHDAAGADGGVTATRQSPYCRLRAVDLAAVRWRPGFWAERFRQCHEVTLPHLYRLMDDPEQGHALSNLRIAAGLEEGEFIGTHWQDEWVYKWLEAASYVYGVTRDAALDARMDAIIAIVARAQQPDGYIATQTIVRGWPRFRDIRHHELYVMGHLITAACIHFRSTGKRNFLAVAERVAAYLYDTFMPRDPALAHFGFNPSYIMGLIELYRTTADRRWLDLTNVFIDMRGSQPGGTDQNQDRVPLREETAVVGHMVLATYLYAGVADAYQETGDQTLLAVLDRLWHDLTERKLYVTGGVCPIHQGLSPRGDIVREAAGPAYVLPNSTSYNETCAQIGNFLWNWRMLGITGEARYADVMELTLYNSIISGIGLDGASWFYTNVLRWYGEAHPLLWQDAHGRFQPGRKQVCCPSNLLRLVAGLHGYVYSRSDEGLWVNLYAATTFDGELLDGARLRLTQETDYPWDGAVRFTIEAAPPGQRTIHLRIPVWAAGATLAVNGTPLATPLVPGSYAPLTRVWEQGDVIDLDLPLRVRLLEGHPQIEEARNQVAVARGPLVYCLESPDLPTGVRLSDVALPRDVALHPRHAPELLGGVTVLEGDAAIARASDWSGVLYQGDCEVVVC